MKLSNSILRRCAAVALLATALAACAAPATPTGTPNLVAEIQADPDLRMDSDRLWIDWKPDGSGLVYVDPSRRLMYLDLAHPRYPRQMSEQAGYAPRFRPDGKAIAFTGGRRQGERTVNTLYLQLVDGGAPIDLLPGERTVKSVSTAKRIHRWLEPTLLSYEEHMGTGVQQLFLLDVPERLPTSDAKLLATRFMWSPGGRKVAGHWTCCPSRFWVWDRMERRFLLQEGPGQGPSLWFEAWADDGRHALVTEWRGNSYQPQSKATLFDLDVETGQNRRVADNAVLAATSGSSLAYVKLGDPMTLVVADARDGRTLWTENLGQLPDRFDAYHWDYRPVFAGGYLFYRTGAGEWRVSTARDKHVAVAVAAPAEQDVHVSWSPDGQHGAVLDATGRIRVIRNPLMNR